MRKSLLILLAIASLSALSAGCASTDRIARMEQEMIDFENARPRQDDDTYRGPFWGHEPMHLPTYRIPSGVGPASSSI